MDDDALFLKPGVAPNPPPFTARQMNEMLWDGIEIEISISIGETRRIRVPMLDSKATQAYTRMYCYPGTAIEFRHVPFDGIDHAYYVEVTGRTKGTATISTTAEWRLSDL